MKKSLLQTSATLLGTLCLFGVPVLVLGLIAWGGDALVNLVVDSRQRHTAGFAFSAIGAMTLASLIALAIGGGLFVLLRKAALKVHAQADALDGAHESSESLPLAPVNPRVRVGLLVSRKGLGSVRRIERRYRAD